MINTLKKIVIVEDNTTLLQLISRKLQGAGIETISCTRAKQALDYMDEMDSLPDLIWLDYYLKGKMDGLDFLTVLREHPKYKSIPVVIISNTASGDKIKSMLALGAEKYLVKAEHQLDSIVNMLVDLVNKDLQSETGAS